MELMVNVYANKSGLARALYDAGMIDHPNSLETFFQSFSRGKSLFQFIDCGPGKERADAKLRGMWDGVHRNENFTELESQTHIASLRTTPTVVISS